MARQRLPARGVFVVAPFGICFLRLCVSDIPALCRAQPAGRCTGDLGAHLLAPRAIKRNPPQISSGFVKMYLKACTTAPANSCLPDKLDHRHAPSRDCRGWSCGRCMGMCPGRIAMAWPIKSAAMLLRPAWSATTPADASHQHAAAGGRGSAGRFLQPAPSGRLGDVAERDRKIVEGMAEA